MHRGCQEQALEQVRRVQRGVRRLVDGFMGHVQTLEALAGAPAAERAQLAEQMRQARSALLEDYWQVERQSTELGRLYAASCRLHASSDPEEVLQALREVCAELLGCSRGALYEIDEGRTGLSLAGAWSIAGNLPARPALGSGPLGVAAQNGEAWWLDTPPSPVYMGGAPLHAAIPLFGAGRVRAVLALLGPLTPAVEPGRAAELLAIHGGTALHGTRLSQRARALMAV